MSLSWPLRRIAKYTVVGGTVLGTLVSLRANQYNIDSIGAVRFGRAAITVFGIGVYYKRNLYYRQWDYDSQEYQEQASKVHKEAAERLLELCRANKGVFIKVGQHIGALDYLLPKEYVETMRVLHSHAPCSSLDDVYRVLREDFKQNPHEIFSEISPEPLGVASLAQVHRAKLKDGSTVAVKVQHPYVLGNSIVDLKTMEVLVNTVAWVFPNFKFKWLVDETKRNIPVELDFKQEAKHTKKVRKMFKHFSWLKVPRIYNELSTTRVLTMEYLDGGQVNDLDYIKKHNINVYEISDKLSQLYSQMIFIEGFVHSDPHPGNILVHNNESGQVDIILLDHGLYATLSNDVRWAYSKLWLSILNRDKVAMKKNCEKLGVGDLYAFFSCMVSGRTWNAIQSGLETTKYTVEEKEAFQKEVPGLLRVITEILAQVNRQLLLILKTNDLLRGIEFTLKTQARITSFLVMSKCCVKSVYGERMKKTHSFFPSLYIAILQQWALLKLSLYYFCLNIRNIFLL